MKKNKIILFIVLILIIIIVLVSAFVLKKDTNQKEKIKEEIIVLNNNVVFKYSKAGWQQGDFKDYNGVLLNVYDGDHNLSSKYLAYDEKWYVFDQARNFYDLTGNLFAYVGDYSINDRNIANEDLTKNEEVLLKEYLNSMFLKYNSDDLEIEKSIMDVDMDGIQEIFYSVTHSSSLDYVVEGNSFVKLLLLTNDSIEEIYNQVSDNNSAFSCSPHIERLITLDESNYLIVNCDYTSNFNSKSMVYLYTNDSFKLVIESK